jgi:hypothetical protein
MRLAASPRVPTAPLGKTSPELEDRRRTAPVLAAPRSDLLVVMATLFTLAASGFAALGADPWKFHPPRARPQGPLAELARLSRERWDVGLLRVASLAILLAVVALVVAAVCGWSPRPVTLSAVTVVLCAAMVIPPVLLQMALRDATAPWFYTNDSTYQTELAGAVVRGGNSPYGHDYRSSGLQRFYSMDGTERPRFQSLAQLRHYPYFPASAVASAGWTWLPRPWNDYRLFVALATLMLIPAALLFPGQLGVRLAIGAALACNPLSLRLAWFGLGDAPCVLGIVLAFGFAARGRTRSAGAALAMAILFKQFAIAAVPALLVLLAVEHSRRQAWRAALTGAVVLAIGFAPFLAASPSDVYRDTVVYGTSTYRIVGYGLSGVLVRLHLVSRASGRYPTMPLLLGLWLPVTVLLAWLQARGRSAWLAGGCFTASVLLLIAIARVFHASYVIYPLAGVAVSALLALRWVRVGVTAADPA